MIENTLEKYGILGLIIFTIIRDGIIPIANKYFPSKIRLDERAQDREDKRQEFEQQMTLRQIEAIEQISKVITIWNDRLEIIESTQKQIVVKMPDHNKKRNVN